MDAGIPGRDPVHSRRLAGLPPNTPAYGFDITRVPTGPIGGQFIGLDDGARPGRTSRAVGFLCICAIRACEYRL